MFCSGGRDVVDVDKLSTPDNIVVLRLLYLYRIIALGSNKHNGDDAPSACCSEHNSL